MTFILSLGVGVMALVRTTITLSEDLLGLVDQYAGPRGRSAFIADAVAARVKREHLGRVIRETAGAARDSPTWRNRAGVDRWVDELRSSDRDPGAAHEGRARQRVSEEGAGR